MGENKKTLGDYLEWGEHELVAFVNGNQSYTKGEGNNLGESNLGVLIFNKQYGDKEFHKKKDGIRFIYKKPSIYKQDSDIMIADFSLERAEVKSEIPLGIFTNYYNNCPLRKGSKSFREARKTLQKYGLY
jgi:hypothetical protein